MKPDCCFLYKSLALQESMSILGVPVMTKKSFMATERALGKCWWEVLKDGMKSAGQEEWRLAIERGDYHQGIPAITVVTDGGWSKQTHKHSYNVKSGVAILLAGRQGNLLHWSTQQVLCCVCLSREEWWNLFQAWMLQKLECIIILHGNGHPTWRVPPSVSNNMVSGIYAS